MASPASTCFLSVNERACLPNRQAPNLTSSVLGRWRITVVRVASKASSRDAYQRLTHLFGRKLQWDQDDGVLAKRQSSRLACSAPLTALFSILASDTSRTSLIFYFFINGMQHVYAREHRAYLACCTENAEEARKGTQEFSTATCITFTTSS